MAPGVYFQETDISQYISTLSNTILGMVGVCPAGPVNQKILITSTTQLVEVFGVPDEQYPMLLAANEFLVAGGNQLWIVRVASGDMIASVSVPTIGSGSPFTVNGAGSGSDYNNSYFVISNGTQKPIPAITTSETLTGASTQALTFTIPQVPVVPGSVKISAGGVPIVTGDVAGVLVCANPSAYTGTINYQTGAISLTALSVSAATENFVVNAYSYADFNLQVFYTNKDSNGNTISINNPETYTGLTLANVVTQINSQSNYLNIPTAPAAFPVPNNYILAGGTDGTDEIEDADFVGTSIGPTGLQIFAYPDQLDVNLIAIPGRSSNSAVYQALITLANTRQDCLVLIDPPSDVNVQNVADWANGEGTYAGNQVINSDRAAIYFPYFNLNNAYNGNIDAAPPSAAALQAFARSDYWQAPAGPRRGVLQNVQGMAYQLDQGDRIFLGSNRINPIGNLKNMGIMVLGQKTATLTASSIDRVVDRMTLLQVEKAITTAMFYYLFEGANAQNWQLMEMEADPYLAALVSQNRLYSGTFLSNTSTNTVDVVNNNAAACACIITLPKTMETISINFVLTAYGANITEVLANQGYTTG